MDIEVMLDSIPPMDEYEGREVGEVLVGKALTVAREPIEMMVEDKEVDSEQIMYSYEDHVEWLKNIRARIDIEIKEAEKAHGLLYESLTGNNEVPEG